MPFQKHFDIESGYKTASNFAKSVRKRLPDEHRAVIAVALLFSGEAATVEVSIGWLLDSATSVRRYLEAEITTSPNIVNRAGRNPTGSFVGSKYQ